ncbi:MAG: pseudouridine synthase [Methanomicrobiales archaeon HGW-Methanomicrobiales-4]|nr:MAG: pseudouridine synthase [Methanomicrobiales archaeon HGW-Methanomicrobiales-4]
MLRRVRILADYQFGKSVGELLFPDTCRFITSRRGGVRQAMLDGKRLATLRAHDGRLTLGLAGAQRLCGILASPQNRVTIQEDVIPFIAAGKSVFAKHVRDADPGIQAGDEVLVVSEDGTLQAIGSAQISGREMCLSMSGVAVQVRKGTDSEDTS